MPFRSPNELHLRSATRRDNISERGARLFGVSVEQFCNWRWQMKNQLTTAEDALKVLQLSVAEREAFQALKDLFQAGITPYYLALMDFENEFDPVRLQAIPRLEELKDRIGVADPLQEVGNSPVKEVVHVYPDRVAFCVAQLCPVYCRYCFRKRRDDEVGLHFNPTIVNQGIDYIASNKNIRDVLITGGDPLIAHDGTLENLLRRLREIPHVEILRIGTRVPVTLPYRITEELADLLAQFHPLWINTHFNCSEELTLEAAAAIDTLLSRGIPVGNQSVLLAGVNDSTQRLKSLLEGLVKMRVRPYYLYQAQTVEGTAHLRVPIEKGLDLMRSLRGRTTGFAIPQYVLDTPSGKIPLSPNHILGRDQETVVLLDLKNNQWREINPLDQYVTPHSLATASDLADSDPVEGLHSI
jgi:lysine 2,3-aminomutase